jgi:hypothetical protein
MSIHKLNKTTHPLSGLLISKNNFFNTPDKVVNLAKKQSYSRAINYPGQRTDNLLQSNDPATREFAVFFAKKLAREIFGGISQFVIHVSFHLNDIQTDEDANQGWVHSDDVTLAGVLYLNKTENNFLSGTSMFNKITPNDFPVLDFQSRKDFNTSNIVTEEYKSDLKNNLTHFEETIRIGNQYNRLIAYDAEMWHRPNTFRTSDLTPRLTLLFFIDKYQYSYPDIEFKNSWID